MAFVGLNATDKEVQDALSCRQIFLERKGYSTPEENVGQNSTNVFLFNPNAAKIVKALGDRHWFVCGRGFEGCTAATTVGLLALGKNVTVLEDAILGSGDNPGGDFDRSVEYLKSLVRNLLALIQYWYKGEIRRPSKIGIIGILIEM